MSPRSRSARARRAPACARCPRPPSRDAGPLITPEGGDDEAAGLPLVVRLAGLRVVCVGAGPVAQAKLRGVRDARADLVVVAPEATPELAAAAGDGELDWRRRGFEPVDLDGAVLVLAATGRPDVNAAVALAAAARATLCVRVDGAGTHGAAGTAGGEGAAGTADMAAAVRRGPLSIAVSTGGSAPALARAVRAEVEATFGPEWGELAVLLAAIRRDPAVRAAMADLDDDERRRRWRSVDLADTLRLIRTGRPTAAKEAVSSCLSSSSG